MIIVNITQHNSTPEQGVVDLQGDDLTALKAALTFESLPSEGEIVTRARAVADLAAKHAPAAAMIGGAPYLMAPLERELRRHGIEPLYAFSTRHSVEEVQPDGSVRKTAVFRHAGFVQAVRPYHQEALDEYVEAE